MLQGSSDDRSPLVEPHEAYSQFDSFDSHRSKQNLGGWGSEVLQVCLSYSFRLPAVLLLLIALVFFFFRSFLYPTKKKKKLAHKKKPP